MDAGESQDIAKSWIRLQQARPDSPEYDAEFWSFEALDELTHERPLEALEVILVVAGLADSDKILGNLGAGPIEDVLLYHGPELIERVEAEAAKNPPFRRALKAVWLDPAGSIVSDRLSRITENDPPL